MKNRLRYGITPSLLVLECPVHVREPYRMWAGLFRVLTEATFRALEPRREKPKHRMNPKNAGDLTRFRRFTAVLPRLSIVAVTLAALVYAAWARTLPWDLFVVNAVWGLWIVWTLLAVCWAALQRWRSLAHSVLG